MVEDDLLVYLWGIGGEVNEGMRGDGQLQVDLANFWFSPPAPPYSMAKGKVQGRTKHVNETSKINFAAWLSANGCKYACVKDLTFSVGM